MVAKNPIKATSVRYIKLGTGGSWETECIATGVIRYGFDSATAERFPFCVEGRWSDLRASFIGQGHNAATATNFVNQTKEFFSDRGAILWVTFSRDQFYWGFLNDTPASQHRDGDGVWRSIIGGWSNKDANGESLRRDNLSGKITKYAAFRGTSCKVDEDAKQYIVRRINGQVDPKIVEAIELRENMYRSAQNLMRLLRPAEFETLVDLVFSTSGWRRQGPVGGSQKTVDFEIFLPSTGERAFVQVKSETDKRELEDYVGLLDAMSQQRMFYVYHSAGDPGLSTDDKRVTLIGPKKLAELTVDAGLFNWLIQRVR